jgi:hypothetical protein
MSGKWISGGKADGFVRFFVDTYGATKLPAFVNLWI